MTWVAVAIGGSALLSTGASLAASDKAADAAEDAGRLSEAQYAQTRRDLAPYREVGGQALNAYARAMGLDGSDSTGGVPSSTSLTMLEGIRTKDKSGNRNVYADEYTGDLYRINGYGEYENLGNIYAAGGKHGTIQGIETSANNRVGIDSKGQFHSRGKTLGTSFQLKDRPATVDTGSVDDDPYGGFMTSPGYQWRLDEGQRGVDRNAAARGRYMSGARDKATVRYGQNFASNEFGNYMNRLAGAAGIGQSATNTGIQAGQNSVAYQGNAMQNAGNARASGYLGVANTLGNGLNNYLVHNAYNQPQNSPFGPYSDGYRGLT